MMRTIEMVCPGCGRPEPIEIEVERDEDEWCGWRATDAGDCPECGPVPWAAVKFRLEHEVKVHGVEWESDDAWDRLRDAADESRAAYARAYRAYLREVAR